MSSSLFLRRSVASQTLRTPANVRLASTQGSSSGPFKTGPSSTETSAQGPDQRGQTTSYVLPAVAGALAIGAFSWLLTRSNKPDVMQVGVGSDGPDKLRSKSVQRSMDDQKANAEAATRK